jgi:protein KTI12
MPLVILCGFPASGKTTLANKLVSFLSTQSNFPVKVVNEETISIPVGPKNALYETAVEEKKIRAALLAAAERHVSKDTVVIVDWLNYIKGYRYQLYCLARAAGTPSICLHCQARTSTCETRSHGTYASALLHDLIARFEEPNGQSRWDAPLFSVAPEEASDSELTLLFTQILTSLQAPPTKPPSLATTASSSISPSFASAASPFKLDQATQEVLDQILQAQQSGLPFIDLSSRRLQLDRRPINAALLARIRRQFIALNRARPIDPARISLLFAEYLLASLDLH